MFKENLPILEIVAGISTVCIAVVSVSILVPTLRGDTAAAWVQAIGAILAIIAAFLIGDRQYVAGRALERERRAEDDIRRFEIVMAILARTEVITGIIAKAFEKSQMGDLPIRTNQYLTDCAKAFQQLPAFDMPDPKLVVLATSIADAVQELSEILGRARNEADSPAMVEFPSDDSIAEKLNEVLNLTREATQLCVNEILQRRF
jgi:hypothetical protein